MIRRHFAGVLPFSGSPRFLACLAFHHDNMRAGGAL